MLSSSGNNSNAENNNCNAYVDMIIEIEAFST